MRRYIDADKLLRNLPDDLPYKASVKRVLIQAPKADVVPKSEVTRLIGDYYDRCDECRTNCASAVAREIFEEIDKTTFADMDFFKELKKKYTEDE